MLEPFWQISEALDGSERQVAVKAKTILVHYLKEDKWLVKIKDYKNYKIITTI